MILIEQFEFPNPPTFPPELVDDCRREGDYRPMLFEWYKHVGLVCNQVASIQIESPAVRKISTVHYSILVGLLNRCSRLMMANMALSSSSNGYYGETTQIIDRCIAESAIKVQWLTAKGDEESFTRYLADGLKKDLIAKAEVMANIANRAGTQLQIETRILKSIDDCLQTSGLSEKQVSDAKKIPDLLSMMLYLKFPEGMYTAIQKMGSHSIHGTWTDLILHYLELDDQGAIHLRDHDVKTHHGQFVLIIYLVLRALKRFLLFMAADPSYFAEMITYFPEVQKKVHALDKEDYGKDFDRV